MNFSISDFTDNIMNFEDLMNDLAVVSVKRSIWIDGSYVILPPVVNGGRSPWCEFVGPNMATGEPDGYRLKLLWGECANTPDDWIVHEKL